MKLPIRSQIIAPKDYVLISLDLSQAEAWVVAFKANEKRMKNALQYGDIHSQTGRALFDLPDSATKENGGITEDQRYLGKKFNHACNYRMGYIKAAETINKESDKPPFVTVSNTEAKNLHAKWNSYYNLKNWWLEIEELLRRDHYLITPYGRKRAFYSPLGDDLYKEATAYIPQSTIADHMFGKVQKELGIEGGLKAIYERIVVPSKFEIRLINTSHDSCIIECPAVISREIAAQAIAFIRRPMIVEGEQFTIPADGKIGERWDEKEMEKIS